MYTIQEIHTIIKYHSSHCSQFTRFTVHWFTKLATFFWMSGSANLPWKYAILLPLDLSLKSFPGTSPVALPLMRIHTGTTLKTWSMYVAHFSAVIWVLQNRRIQSCSSCLVRGTSLATVLLSSFQTISMGFKSGLSN